MTHEDIRTLARLDRLLDAAAVLIQDEERRTPVRSDRLSQAWADLKTALDECRPPEASKGYVRVLPGAPLV